MLSNIIGAVVISIVSITNWKKLLNKSINFKDYRLYIGFILMTILLIINFLLNYYIIPQSSLKSGLYNVLLCESNFCIISSLSSKPNFCNLFS